MRTLNTAVISELDYRFGRVCMSSLSSMTYGEERICGQVTILLL